jgi:hypothetical protein
MRGAGSQSLASFVIRSHVKPSFWLRRRSIRPEIGHVMPERRERPTICGYRIVSEMAYNDLLQPVTLIWDSLVHSQPQLRLDFLELRLHAVATGLPLKLEESPTRLTANEGPRDPTGPRLFGWEFV